jgi:hypothetical protein
MTCAKQDLQTLQTHLRKTHRPPSSTAQTLLGTSSALASSWANFPKDPRFSPCCNAWPAAIAKHSEPNMTTLAITFFVIFPAIASALILLIDSKS